MKKLILIGVASLACVSMVMAQGLIVPNTSGDSLGTAAKPFGNVYAQTMSNETAVIEGSNTTINGTMNIKGTATLDGAATVGTTLGVTGNATMSSNAYVARALQVDGGVKLTYTVPKIVATTPNSNDYTIVHAPRGVYTNLLPDANTVLGHVFNIVHRGGVTNMFVDTDATDTFDYAGNKEATFTGGAGTNMCLTIQATGAHIWTVLNADPGITFGAIP